MKVWSAMVGWMGFAILALAQEEGSSQRLEKAQGGMVEASWPRKPDNRMSSLSGKMKDMTEISPRFYGQDKEFRGKEAGEWQKEARWGSRGNWDTPAGRGWEEARWSQSRDWTGVGQSNGKYQASQELAADKTMAYRELERQLAPDWSSRSASLGAQTDGSLRMYEGRLTRVREQVWQEEKNARDLGPGRQEKFTPEEVEKILSQPAGQARGAKAQSPAASPLAAAGN